MGGAPVAEQDVGLPVARSHREGTLGLGVGPERIWPDRVGLGRVGLDESDPEAVVTPSI